MYRILEISTLFWDVETNKVSTIVAKFKYRWMARLYRKFCMLAWEPGPQSNFRWDIEYLPKDSK